MLSRQESVNSQDERIANVEKGLTYAKEAVQLDPQDGLSWGCLGNAHLSYFFQVKQNPKILKLAISAYFQAVRPSVFSIIKMNGSCMIAIIVTQYQFFEFICDL